MLGEHVVGKNILLPGVGYVELAFAAVIRYKNLDTFVALVDITFVRPCVISDDA